jgi:ribosome-associated protein
VNGRNTTLAKKPARKPAKPNGTSSKKTDKGPKAEKKPKIVAKATKPTTAHKSAKKNKSTPAGKALAKPARAKPAHAKPARAKPTHAASTPNRPDSVARKQLSVIIASLEDMKAENTVTIDLAGKTSLADYMVVSSGRSQRHVASIADDIARKLKEAGFRGVRSEGKQIADWVLIDSGDVIVHVFRPDVRTFYDIEKMWAGRDDAAP